MTQLSVTPGAGRRVTAATGRLLGHLDRLVALLAGAVLIGVTVLLTVNAAARSLGVVLFSGGPTLAGLLVLWLTFVGAYIPARRGGHITVDMIGDRLPAPAFRALRVAVALVAAGLCAVSARIGWEFAAFRFASGQIDQMLFIPTGWFYAPLPAGFALCALAWLHAAAAAIWGDG
ncbi:hypothetical protein GCM10011360_01250 [Primorskyibacter flagellatus]|uniref:TRAP transporter small permease protein n=1 Tax=Primorskyibacter flagellatus TaxID=1387277 RepID=A0A917E9H3_9RHOB|nr:TRAP transporter small permease subunit [Primorskyibacter flagellatus]GGE16247.1 hypothetical protein GCM10011360_01250 [Primorskyibacter flagellatus]